MKYIVVQLTNSDLEACEMQELLASEADIKLVLCSCEIEVFDAIQSVEVGGDWRVFEVDHGKAYPRSVSFLTNDGFMVGVDIQTLPKD